MATHLIPLSEGFSLWKYVALRGTGFSIQELSRLRAPALLTATNHLVQAQAQLSAHRRQAAQALDALIGPSAPQPLQKMLVHLKKKRLPRGLAGESAIDAILEPLLAENQSLLAMEEDYQKVFAGAMEGILSSLREFSKMERFREAVTWQNPEVIGRALEGLSANPSSRGTKDYHLVVNYLQRYCAKNDTIGFFGPTGWATLDADSAGVFVPGSNLVDKREVLFEYWCLDAFAQVASRIDDIRPYLPVRKNPLVRVDGVTVTLPSGSTTVVAREMAILLQACDGRLAREIVASCLPVLGGEADEEECFEMLEEMDEGGLLFWRILLPTGTEGLEEILALALRDIPGEQADRLRSSLRELVACRDEVAASAGDSKRLLASQQALAAKFENLTGLGSHRKGGQVYAGRGLCYEETRRDVEVTLGQPFIDSIAPALGLVLTSARWFCEQLAAGYELALDREFQSLLTEGESQIALVRLMERAPDIVNGPMIDGVVQDLHARWASILGLEAADKTVLLTSAELAARVQEAFAASRTGWPEARFHSPDIMVAAESFEQLARGEGLAVLGEVHVGRNTLFAPSHYWQCPFRPDLIAALDQDMATLIADVVVPPEMASRATMHSPVADHYEVELGETPSRRRPDRRLAAADLCVESQAGRLQIVSRDGRLRFDIMALFQTYLRGAAFSRFSLASKDRFVPRVQIDNLVVQRTTWSFAPDELAFASIPRGPEQFLSARTWVAMLGLPDRVFVKIPEEAKPVYADLASPISIEILARMVRRSSRVVLSEMLPSLEQCWLRDAKGATYTSELRIVARDEEAWQSPPPVPRA